MKFCPDCEYPICDFCQNYAFNGNKDGVYLGFGVCEKKIEPREPEDNCSDFICFNIQEVG